MQPKIENYIMQTKLRQAIAAFILGVFFLALSVRAQSPASVRLMTPEDYTICNEALKAYVGREKALSLSIVRFTKLADYFLEDTYDSVQLQSAVKDLRRKNAATYEIEPKFDVPFKYELADEMEQIGGARVAPPGHQNQIDFIREQMAKLEKRSREHFTQVQLSAPGISEDGQVAIVYIAISFAGEFRILHKKDNKWIVDPKPLGQWIS